MSSTAVAKRKPKFSARRQEIRDRRHEMRELIQMRWNERSVLRYFEESFTSEVGDSLTLERLLAWSPHATVPAMLWAAKVPDNHLRRLVGYLVRVIELKEMAYEEYLQTDEWKDRATECKRRFHFTCAFDEDHPAEHAHHRTYLRRGRERPDDLIPLCSACHAKHHKRKQ